MKPGVVPPDERMRQRRARPWRGLIAMGGLLLFSTAFMPAVPGCNEDIVPAHEVRSAFSSPGSHDWADLMGGLLIFGAAYAWGLITGVAALLRLLRGSHGRRERGWGSLVVLGWAATLIVVGSVVELFDSGNMTGLGQLDPPWFAGLVVCVAGFPYQLTAMIRLAHRAYLAVSFMAAISACAWFVGWAPFGYYGVRLSFLASLVILVGIIGESATLTRRRWLGTIWRLATCRLRDADIARAACPKCQYDLRGAAEMRCPECGRPFSFDELGLWPEEVGFGQRLGAE